MNRFLGIIILIALVNSLWAQSTNNPFDLKYRQAKPVSKEVDKQVASRPDTVKSIVFSDSVNNISRSTEVLMQDSLPSALINSEVDSTAASQNPFESAIVSDTEADTASATIDNAEGSVEKTVPIASPKHYGSRGFQIFFLLLSLLFLIFIVNVERSFIRDLWRVISNENYSSLHHRNQRNTMRQVLLLMGYLIFIFQAGLFITKSLHVYPFTAAVMTNLWISIAAVLGVYLVRHVVIRYLKWLFNNEKELSLFAFDISIFNTMVGLILLPINILLIFGPEGMYNALIIIGIVVVVAAYVLRQLRWMLASRRFILNSLFLFFIYLCAVEILPLWTISKIFW